MSTTTKKAPSLPVLLRELRAATERTGQDHSLTLSHGARVAWRLKDGVLTFAVSRPKVRVGDRELIIFQSSAGVPHTAERVPCEGQKETKDADGLVWFRVGWRWRA